MKNIEKCKKKENFHWLSEEEEEENLYKKEI